jgi:hypothetical protein
MERGLLWLPLLGLFIWLAWAGWNEYQKLEAYQRWAEPFDRAKYDIYAALGQQGAVLTWGRPTRQGPVQRLQADLTAVDQLEVYSGDRPCPPDAALPRGCQACIRLTLKDGTCRDIPFTDGELAQRWGDRLQADQATLSSQDNSPPVG